MMIIFVLPILSSLSPLFSVLFFFAFIVLFNTLLLPAPTFCPLVSSDESRDLSASIRTYHEAKPKTNKDGKEKRRDPKMIKGWKRIRKEATALFCLLKKLQIDFKSTIKLVKEQHRDPIFPNNFPNPPSLSPLPPKKRYGN